MNSIKRTTVVALLGLALFSIIISADENRGQKIYLKKLKAACGFNGTKFATKHTQQEWEDIHNAGKFADELTKICPKAEIDPKFVQDLYDFSYHYAKDSGNVPSC